MGLKGGGEGVVFFFDKESESDFLAGRGGKGRG